MCEGQELFYQATNITRRDFSQATRENASAAARDEAWRDEKQELLKKLEELDLSSLRSAVPLAVQPGEVLTEFCSLNLSPVVARSEV